MKTKGTKTKADIAKEVSQLRDTFLYLTHQLEQRDRIIENSLAFVLEAIEPKQVQEIEYTEEELEKQFTPLIGLYGIEKETGKLIKLNRVIDNWKIDTVTEPTETEQFAEYTFKKEDEIRKVKANNHLEAFTKLRQEIMSEKAEAVNG